MPEKISTIQRGGSRFYVNSGTCEKVPGVTTVVNMLPKPFLPRWSANMAAELAIDSLDYLAEMAQRDREGAIKYVAGAAYRYTKSRANIGSMAHDLFERMIRGEGRYTERDRSGGFAVRVHPDLEPYRANFAEFLDSVQPELIRAEDVAWSDTHKYAGSFDALLSIMDDDGTPVTVITDWKTSKSTYPDVALQMSAYGFADRLIDADGNSEPMPSIDGAAVLHITPDQWSFKPVRFDAEVFEHFLTLRRTFDWDRDVYKTVIGKPVASGGSSAIVTGTQRRGK
ncbi:hypothetical protein [Streptomyces spectabilis]|uniref:PD-(D/E)XK endonuclease-like domain-containing protein n=1 Tax=Streptomyces spectabilis TaxID=68270 RepID=A0A516RF90_STRST|nr:hypothetical protein [Streptomyces spectabilis]QDQ14311.1 hypothetical protein FH965_30160 [Streptomyces spectabilis]